MPVLIISGAIFALIMLLHNFLKQQNRSTIDRLIHSAADPPDPVDILLVTAHPDDEAMFFAPLILNLVEHSGMSLHLLCLTTGNFYGQGEERRLELYKSGSVLGVPLQQIYLTDHPDLQDGSSEWDVEVASRVIENYVKRTGAKIIVTFDEYGVSGHRNHRSTCQAVRKLLSRISQHDIRGYVLESCRVWRKYSWLLDLPYSYLTSGLLLVSSWQQVSVAREAMRAHESQWVWFRRVYVQLSRYMLLNTLREIVPDLKQSPAKHEPSSKEPEQTQSDQISDVKKEL